MSSSLPKSWSVVPLGELGSWRGGGTPSKAEPTFWNGSIPWVSPKDMKCSVIADTEDRITHDAVENSATKLIPAGSVLVVTRSGILERTLPVATTSGPVTINQDLKALTPREGVDPRYVALGLKAFEQQILRDCTKSGTTVANVEFASFLRFKIPLAPLAEQRRIVAEIENQFTRLDAGVAALERVRAQLKRYRAAVRKAACEGLLVPTEAELARREGREFESGEKLLARVLEERRARWEDDQFERLKASGKTPKDDRWKGKYREPGLADASNLPPLPEGWAWATLNALTARIVDGTHHTPQYVAEGIPFISVKDIRGGKISFDGCKRISEEEHELLAKRCLPEHGDLLVTKSGTIGRTAVVRTDQPFSLFVSVALLKPASANVAAAWLDLVFQRFMASVNIANDVKGTAIKNLHLEDLANIAVPLPSVAEQKRVLSKVAEALSIADAAETVVEAQQRKGAALRCSILRSAFDGTLLSADPNEPPVSIPSVVLQPNPRSRGDKRGGHEEARHRS